MEMNEYQTLARKTSNHDGLTHADMIVNYALGLCGEAGEVAEKLKKLIYHKVSDVTADDIAAELGDVQWYVSQIADLLGRSLEEIAAGNVAKLESRYPNGFRHGGGER